MKMETWGIFDVMEQNVMIEYFISQPFYIVTITLKPCHGPKTLRLYKVNNKFSRRLAYPHFHSTILFYHMSVMLGPCPYIKRQLIFWCTILWHIFHTFLLIKESTHCTQISQDSRLKCSWRDGRLSWDKILQTRVNFKRRSKERTSSNFGKFRLISLSDSTSHKSHYFHYLGNLL